MRSLRSFSSANSSRLATTSFRSAVSKPPTTGASLFTATPRAPPPLRGGRGLRRGRGRAGAAAGAAGAASGGRSPSGRARPGGARPRAQGGAGELPEYLAEFPPEAVSHADALEGAEAGAEGAAKPAGGLLGACCDTASQSAGLLLLSALVLVTGVGNRVMNKVALVPLCNHVFFLGQFLSVCYVVTYFTILWLRTRAGLVTAAMHAYPKRPFAVIGALEALSVLTMLVGASRLQGPLLPVLSQTFLIWQLVLSKVVLGRRYTLGQLFGVLLVAAGLVIAVLPSAGSVLLDRASLPFAVLYAGSTIFPALATIRKEMLFDQARQRLGQNIDLFIVNSYGSLFQAGFVLALLPAISTLQGVPIGELHTYVAKGFQCFTGSCSAAAACGSPGMPLLYVFVNLLFNMSALKLLQRSSAVYTSLVASSIVPLAIWAFTFPLPYLGAPAALSWRFFAGSGVLVAGLISYNLARTSKKSVPASA